MCIEIWKNKSTANLKGEKWKSVNGYTGYYEVSNMGRVKSLARYVYNAIHGKIWLTEKILSQYLKHGYLVLVLYKKGVKSFASVHILVAKAWIPNPLKLPEVNHLRGMKTDCRSSQLEWSTESDNMKHSYEIGLHKKMNGEIHPATSLTNSVAINIFNEKGRTEDIANQYNTTINIVRQIKQGKTWHHVTGKTYVKKYKQLNPVTVISIFNMNLSHRKIAIIFGISKGAVTAIKTGRNWSQITGKNKLK